MTSSSNTKPDDFEDQSHDEAKTEADGKGKGKRQKSPERGNVKKKTPSLSG